MINLRYYLFITLMGVVIYLLITPAKIEGDIDNSANAEVIAVREEESKSSTIIKSNPADSTAAVLVVEPTKTGLHLKENFIGFLSQMNKCLDIKNSIDPSLYEPTIENVLSSIQNDLGEPVIRSEDWTSTEIELANGERKLIKIETNYENDDLIRTLKYFQVTKEGLIQIELTKEQTEDPTPTLIASLESEGKILRKEKSERIFFQNGEEILFTENNSQIDFIEMTKAGRTLRCKELSQAPCVCQ